MPRTYALFRLVVFVTFSATCALVGLKAALGLDFEQLQQALTSRFGQTQLPVYKDWQALLADSKARSDSDKIRAVNDFFNRRIGYADDLNVWGQSDYWATPIEFIGRGWGDCEDFSIAKYYSLINIGIPVNKLRLVYVKATQNTPSGTIQQAHMVLAYYATPNAEPQVLDNLNPEIRPASQRPDLAPIFSFNSAGLWQGTGNQSSKSNLSRWQDLLQRARAEGFQ